MAGAQSARELALAFHAAQARRARGAANRIQELWRQLDERDISGSWQRHVGPQIVRTVAAGQMSSAAAADTYVDSIVEAEGSSSDRAGRVMPQAFSGAAADGRSLDTLMLLSVITSKQGLAAGMPASDALMMGLRQALMLGSSEVTQAGRGAVGASMAGQRTIQGYVRVVQPPACARCVILAGKEYGWNAGFQRHPRCDCVHLPTTLVARGRTGRGSISADRFSPTTRPGEGARGFINPSSYFGSLSRAEQDRVFTAAGARAVREGGDINAIVNARRGMYTTTSYGRTLRATREGTTTRGSFYRSERARDIARGRAPAGIGRSYRLTTPRLLPEQIFELAESRDEAIAMLRRYGYLT